MTIKRVGSLIGFEAEVVYKGGLVVGLVVQETYNMVKVKIGGRYLFFPKEKVTLLLNASKVKGTRLKGLAWHRLKR